MPAITYDGQSLTLDGRREWLVCATIPYAAHPRDEWPARIADAGHAGFNCVLVPCVWAAHETRKGVWNFTGDHDIRAFLLLIRKAGLRAILRVGPFVGAPWDMGGIPPWVGASATRSEALANREGLVAASQAHWSGVRAGTPEFLDAASKWITALAEQTRDQQYTVGAGGPVLLVQVEHEWLCAHEVVAEGYLGELARFVREAGFTVPLANCNNLHAGAEGEIDAWSGATDSLATARQLSAVRPAQPPMLLEVSPGPPPAWGHAARTVDPVDLQATLAEGLAGAAQFNLARFAPGALAGFSGGRSGDAAGSFFCPADDHGVITDGGAHTRAYALVKRLATFASSFGRVFAHRERANSPSVLAPPAPGGASASLVHIDGQRGAVDFVFAPAPGAPLTILAPDGSSHALHTGDQRVAWRLQNVHLHGRATLDFCDACAFALVGKVFVCFGPAGSRALLSINAGPIDSIFPEGPAPTIEEHDGITVVLCNEAQIDATIATDDAVHLCVRGLSPAGVPEHHPDFRARIRISAEGVVERVNAPSAAKAPRSARAPALGEWTVYRCDEHALGESPRYAAITGPATLDMLGAPAGYGWLRARFTPGAAGSLKAGLLQCADRAHLFLSGEPLGVVGVGPGATPDLVSLPLKKRAETLVVLIDNLGRAAGGSSMGEPKGLWGPPMEVAPLRAGTPTLEPEPPLSPLDYRAPLIGVRDTDRTDPRRLTWTIQHRRKTPIAVCIDAFAAPALLIVNDEIVDFLDHADRPRVILDERRLKTGNNSVQLAFLLDHGGVASAEDAARIMRPGVRFVEIVGPMASKVAWAFAKWEPPPPRSFHAPGRAAMAGAPAWWRTSFPSPAHNGEALFLDLAGLTKGQAFLNGKNLSRYFVATDSGKSVAGQRRVRLPSSWLNSNGVNDVLLFDEHGASPAKTRLVFGAAD